MTYRISNQILNEQKYMEELVIKIGETFNQHNIMVYDEAIEFEMDNIIDENKLIEIFNLFPNTSQFKLSISKFKEFKHLNLFSFYTPTSNEFTPYSFLSVDFISKLKKPKQLDNESIVYDGNIMKLDLLKKLIRIVNEEMNIPINDEEIEEMIKDYYLDLYKGELFIDKSQIKSLKDLAELKEDIQYLFEK